MYLINTYFKYLYILLYRILNRYKKADFDKAAKLRRKNLKKFIASLTKRGGCNLLHSEGLEQQQGHRVPAVVGAFRLLFGGSTHVQLPLTKYEIYLTFSKSDKIHLFYLLLL